MSGGAGHRVHGMGLALEAPTWPVITRDEAAAVLRHFPAAGRLIALRWHSPRPFSAATLLDTTTGAFVLKRHHHTLRDAAGLAQEHTFIAHLRANGLSVPEIMTASDGSGTVAEGDWTYELHRQAPGHDLYRDAPSWTPFASHGHAYAAGIALARLHLAAQGFDAPARPPQPLVGSFGILTAPDPVAGAASYVAARPALAAFLADRPWQRDVAHLFAMQGEGLPARLADQPPLWTHNDWHPSNLLWSDQGDVATVFDFGLADRTSAVHDLATAIERSAIRWLDLARPTPLSNHHPVPPPGRHPAPPLLRHPGLDPGSSFLIRPNEGKATNEEGRHYTATETPTIADPASALALIAGYRSVRPLTPADIATVVHLLPLVHVEFALSEIDYFAGVLGDTDQAAQAWGDYLIGHAQWFRSDDGRAFLAHLLAAS